MGDSFTKLKQGNFQNRSTGTILVFPMRLLGWLLALTLYSHSFVTADATLDESLQFFCNFFAGTVAGCEGEPTYESLQKYIGVYNDKVISMYAVFSELVWLFRYFWFVLLRKLVLV